MTLLTLWTSLSDTTECCSPLSCIICVPIPEFPPPNPHRSVIYNVTTVHMTQLMNLNGAMSFCWQKTNHTVDLTGGKNGNDIVHIYLVATYAQLNKTDSGLALQHFTGCYRKCAMSLWQSFYFYQPVRCWFWNSTFIYIFLTFFPTIILIYSLSVTWFSIYLFLFPLQFLIISWKTIFLPFIQPCIVSPDFCQALFKMALNLFF